jgi:16S rRNA (uracil1498-N3)-methyltransferase
MARRRFFVDRIEGGRAFLNGPDAHHVARVLRAEVGQQYEITDGSELCLARIEAVDLRQVAFRVVEQMNSGEPLPPIVVVAALFKFDHFEWMIEKLTELGVKAVIPVEAARSEPGLFKAAAKRVERWRKIARESSQQSRRVRVPEVRDAVKLAGALQAPFGLKIRMEENPGAPPLVVCTRTWDRASDVAVAIGPEGGWTNDERDLMKSNGWLAASLGSTVLRSETAAIAAAAVLNQAIALGPVWSSTDRPSAGSTGRSSPAEPGAEKPLES